MLLTKVTVIKASTAASITMMIKRSSVYAKNKRKAVAKSQIVESFDVRQGEASDDYPKRATA